MWILDYVLRMVAAAVGDITVAGTTVGSYLLGRFIGSSRIPPVGLAVIGGGIAVALTGSASVQTTEWTLPVIAVPAMAFSVPGVIAISLPMVVMAMGLSRDLLCSHE